MPSVNNDTTQETQSGPSRRGVLKSGAILAGGGLIGLPALTGSAAASGCAFTPGYWKNHPEAWMPKTNGGSKPHIHFDFAQLESGPNAQKAYYFDSNGFPSAMEILNMPTKGDKSIIMAQHFIAAILNSRNDTKDWCIRGYDGPSYKDGSEYHAMADWVRLARKFFSANPVGSGARSWRVNGYDYEQVKDKLEAYNEGRLCACGDD